MTTLRQRLADLRKENKARTAAHKVGLINQTSTRKKGPDRTEASSRDWPEFRDLSDEKLEKKLYTYTDDEMLELYKKLEQECGYRIDPENYKRHKIVKNFILLWTRKKLDEKRVAANLEKYGEKLIPLSEAEIDQVMSDRTRSSRITLISKKGDDSF